ncbi:MAG: hypothetical protein KDA84_21310 [Planctomycetaceae bacterium]|nr:hypothetical protein [Planctomycetaceae bacterium]
MNEPKLLGPKTFIRKIDDSKLGQNSAICRADAEYCRTHKTMAAFYTLLYMANPDEAKAIADSDEPQDQWPNLWLRLVGDLELVELWRVLDEATADDEGTLMGDLLYQSGDEETFVMETPDSFVTAVAEIPESKLPEIAEAWGRVDELSHWKAHELVETLSELRTFCQKANSTGCPILQVSYM